jgi:hypothetical protein
MTLDDFIDGIDGFHDLESGEQILAIAWYLTRHAARPDFTELELIAYFEHLSLPRPIFFSGILPGMSREGIALFTVNGYRLARSTLSTLDAKYGQRATTIAVQNLLAELPAKLTQAHDRAYLDEALICFKHGAFRAAIVMAWNLAFDHLCTVVAVTYLSKFNAQLPTTYPKARVTSISKKDDFADLKEYEVLQVCRSAGITSPSLHKLLQEKLDRRNIAAHPNGIEIDQLTTEAFILDLVNNVVLAFK